MSALGELLRRAREDIGLSINRLGDPKYNERIKKRIPHQTLSSYERGAILPRRSSLPRIAQCYGLSLANLEATYSGSAPQTAHGAYSEPFYKSVLETTVSGDTLVTVTQKSLVAERPSGEDVAEFIATFIAKGGRFSFVAYEPAEPDYDGPWASNHKSAARRLADEFRVQGLSIDSEQLTYCLLGKPTRDDYGFLEPNSIGSPILCRSENSSVEPPYLAWRQMPTDRQRVWVPYDTFGARELRTWLHFSLGMQLPRIKAPPTAPDKEARELRLLTLADYLAQ